MLMKRYDPADRSTENLYASTETILSKDLALARFLFQIVQLE